ncbi:MAG: hypothetical protein U5M51_09405 [Emticicia sp.]|nr:hypothetical protein [Emticicia sp.]
MTSLDVSQFLDAVCGLCHYDCTFWNLCVADESTSHHRRKPIKKIAPNENRCKKADRRAFIKSTFVEYVYFYVVSYVLLLLRSENLEITSHMKFGNYSVYGNNSAIFTQTETPI